MLVRSPHPNAPAEPAPSPRVAPKAARRSRGARGVTFLLLLVASPCATELALGTVAMAFDDAASVTDACCGEGRHRAADTDADGAGERPAPGAQRSDCGCCHSFAPTAFAPQLESPVRFARSSPPDITRGVPRDGHTEPPFRPPANA